jgi:hypothetical protein
MVKDTKSQDDFYIVRLSDLECMILAGSFQEAASNGVKKIIDNKGRNTNLSFWISVDKIKNYEIETCLFYTSSILNDLGYFNLSKNLENLSDFFLDKGKNPH